MGAPGGNVGLCTQIVTVYLGRRGKATRSMASSARLLASFHFFLIWMCFLGGKRMPGKTQVCDSSISRGKYSDVFPSWLVFPLKMSLYWHSVHMAVVGAREGSDVGSS